jgi:hypothetical protein
VIANMLFKTMLFGLLAAGITTAAQSTTTKGSISGIVQEAGSGSPIAGAQVYVSPGGKSTKTDAKGRYEIKELTAGTYKVSADAYFETGPGPHGTKVAQMVSGQDLTIDFLLSPKASVSGRVGG